MVIQSHMQLCTSKYSGDTMSHVNLIIQEAEAQPGVESKGMHRAWVLLGTVLI